ncbi:MAG: DUF1566 domain-containing protein [Lentisphaerae bacterium]|nr:DUF1566 domain-containing protein [Lentisphaerota bacterium]
MKRNNQKHVAIASALALLPVLVLGCEEAAPNTSRLTGRGAGTAGGYVVVDSGQVACYDARSRIADPRPGRPFHGQDAQHSGPAPRYADNGNGTVTDLQTGLIWQQSPDTNGDGQVNAADKLTHAQSTRYPSTVNARRLGGHSDWRLPTIKELYSLVDFRGLDPSGPNSRSTSGLTPFIDDSVFQFAYGDLSAGERIIDSQWASSTVYVDPSDGKLLFGVNFADGRIKGYWTHGPRGEKTFYAICVRGNPSYGINVFVDNGDDTVTDRATGLMWSQSDSGVGLNWEEALAWAADRNAEGHLGHGDWRLPNIKELQSIVDYGRSPGTTGSASIHPLFRSTPITNEEGKKDFGYYWSGTTHARYPNRGDTAAYIAFGRGLGYMHGEWRDVHGAGCQRSDPKAGSAARYPFGRGPQGDAIRIRNFVRLVRTVPGGEGSVK